MKKNTDSALQRIKAFFKENEWDFRLIALALVAFIFDAIGFKMLFEQNDLNGEWWDFAYLSIRLFGFDLQTPAIDTAIPWTLEIGRWLSASTTIGALLLAVQHIFRDKWKLWEKGSGHIVIIGAGSKGKTLGLDWIKSMKDPTHCVYGKLVVYIEIDKTNTNIDILKENGVVTIFGDATDEQILTKAKVTHAEYVVCVTDSDATNMEIISKLSEMVENRKEKLKCYVHLLHNEFYTFFEAKKFNPKNPEQSGLNIKIFNINSNSARMMFNEKPLGHNKLIDAASITSAETKIKVAILGFGKLGESILVHLLHLGHFYNENPIEVTVVYDQDRDENANLIDEFTKQYNIGIDKEKQENTHFEEYWKVRFIDDGDFDREDLSQYAQLVVAYEDEFTSLSNLMKLLKKYNDEILTHDIDIAIYSNSFASTADVIDKGDSVFKMVRTFGEIDKTCSYEMVIGQILDKQAALNNKQYNELHGYDDKNKSVMEEWFSLTMFLQDSNRYLMEHNQIKKWMIARLIKDRQAVNVYEEIKASIEKQLFNYPDTTINWDKMGLQQDDYALKLTEEEMIQLAKVEHKRWNAFHILNGWKTMSLEELEQRVAGKTGHKQRDGSQKDKNKKRHACIVGWDTLDKVSELIEHNYKSDDLETIMRIPSLEKIIANSAKLD